LYISALVNLSQGTRHKDQECTLCRSWLFRAFETRHCCATTWKPSARRTSCSLLARGICYSFFAFPLFSPRLLNYFQDIEVPNCRPSNLMPPSVDCMPKMCTKGPKFCVWASLLCLLVSITKPKHAYNKTQILSLCIIDLFYKKMHLLVSITWPKHV
jgi:hypothetical protein